MSTSINVKVTLKGFVLLIPLNSDYVMHLYTKVITVHISVITVPALCSLCSTELLQSSEKVH